MPQLDSDKKVQRPVRFGDTQWEQLREEAKAVGKPISELVREAVDTYFSRKETDRQTQAKLNEIEDSLKKIKDHLGIRDKK